MRPTSILYAVFCLAVVGVFIFAAARSYSPFASGGPRTIVGAMRGPSHK